MPQVGKSIVCIAADPRKRTAPKDVKNGNGQVQFYAGNDVEVQLALFDNGAFIDDLANIASWRPQLKAMGSDDAPPAHDDPAILDEELLNAALEQTTTEATWNDGSKQHAAFEQSYLASGRKLEAFTGRSPRSATAADLPAGVLPAPGGGSLRADEADLGRVRGPLPACHRIAFNLT